MTRRLVALALVPLLLGACSTDRSDPAGVEPQSTGSTGSSPTSPAATEATAACPAHSELPGRVGRMKRPQVELVTGQGCRVRLDAWTWCGDGGCVDGFYDEDALPVITDDVVAVDAGEAGWSFQVQHLFGPERRCRRTMSMTTPETTDQPVRLDLAGPPGSRVVTLFGNDPDGGDAIYAFRWDTATGGSYPDAASGDATVLADQDGELASYGVEVGVRDLAEQPARATATVTVTDRTGREVKIPVRRRKQCHDRGVVAFTAPEDAAAAATRLGPGPFTYTVDLRLDGTRYTGTGVWPRDTNEEIAPGIPLSWTPALPVWQG